MSLIVAFLMAWGLIALVEDTIVSRDPRLVIAFSALLFVFVVYCGCLYKWY
jgi:hypothetical protein